MIVRALVAAVALTALAAGPAAGKTGPPLQPFPHPETSERPPVSDGARYFVVNARPGLVRVYDTRTGRADDVAVSPNCAAVGGTPGLALLTCAERTTYERHDVAFLLRLSDRSITAPPGQAASTQASTQWLGIGRHWLRGTAYAHGAGKVVGGYLNWRTGEWQSNPDDYDATELDIDEPELAPYPYGVVDSSGALTLRWRLPDWDLLLTGSGPSALLRRCGRPGPCANATLSAGLVTWSRAGAVHAYDARGRRRLGWSLPGTAHSIVHTRTHVLVAVRPDGDDPPTLMWARVR